MRATTPRPSRWAPNLPDGAVTARAVGKQKLEPAGRQSPVPERLTPRLVDPAPGLVMRAMAVSCVSAPGETIAP